MPKKTSPIKVNYFIDIMEDGHSVLVNHILRKYSTIPIEVTFKRISKSGDIKESDFTDTDYSIMGIHKCDEFKHGTEKAASILTNENKTVMMYSRLPKSHQDIHNIIGLDSQYRIPTAGIDEEFEGSSWDAIMNAVREVNDDTADLYETDFWIKGDGGANGQCNIRMNPLSAWYNLASCDESSNDVSTYIRKILSSIDSHLLIQKHISFVREYRIITGFGVDMKEISRDTYGFVRELDKKSNTPIDGFTPLESLSDKRFGLNNTPFEHIVRKCTHLAKHGVPMMTIDIGQTDDGEFKLIEFSCETALYMKKYIGYAWLPFVKSIQSFVTNGSTEWMFNTDKETMIREIRDATIRMPIVGPYHDLHPSIEKANKCNEESRYNQLKSEQNL
jgi:hypothetical protein